MPAIYYYPLNQGKESKEGGALTERTKHLILAGSLIDGSGGPIMKNQVMTVESGLITSISPEANADHRAAQVTDLSRCVVLPVLIDSHVHLCMSGSIDPVLRKSQLHAGYDDLVPVIAEHLRHHFSHGILAVRDGGDRLGSVQRYLRELHDKSENPVIVQSPGVAFHQKDRYGALIADALEPEESLLQSWRRRGQQGDLIKIVNSGLNSVTRFGAETRPQFSEIELRELVLDAKPNGRSIMVHANGRLPVRNAVQAGCDSIEHGFFMGRENLDLMADTGTFWVPTVYTMKACGEHAKSYRAVLDRQVVEKNLESQLQQLAYAREKGVRVALGTDSGSIGVLHGESMMEEMKLFMRAGYSLSEVIYCASEQSARLLGLENFGEIRVGKPANFLVTKGTPAQLPRKLSYLEAIYLNGKPSPIYRRDPDYTSLRKYEGVDFGGKVRY